MLPSCPGLSPVIRAKLMVKMHETKQQSSKSKSPNSLRPKKVRQVKSKVKSMLIIFFDINEIAHKEFVMADQTGNSTYYSDVL
jgi:phage portal protein BeeE